jgi:hypothetical protein
MAALQARRVIGIGPKGVTLSGAGMVPADCTGVNRIYSR